MADSAASVTQSSPRASLMPQGSHEPSPVDHTIYLYAVLGKVFFVATVASVLSTGYFFYHGMILTSALVLISAIAFSVLWQVCADVEESIGASPVSGAAAAVLGTGADSKLQSGEPVGFHNGRWRGWWYVGGRDCFINSALHGLLRDRELLTALKELPVDRVRPDRQGAFRTLLQFFEQYEKDVTAGRSVSEFNTNTLRVLYPFPIDEHTQLDAGEFLRGIYNLFPEQDQSLVERYPRLFFCTETVIEYRKVEGETLSEEERATLEQQKKALQEDRESVLRQRTVLVDNTRREIRGEMSLQLLIPAEDKEQPIPVQELLDAYLRKNERPVSDKALFLESPEGGIDYYQQSSHQVLLRGQPEHFVLTLNRFGSQQGRTVKIETPVQVSQQIHLQEQMYELQWFVKHIGTAGHGHYIAYVKGRDGIWWCVNDSEKSRVSPADLEAALSQAYFYQFKKAQVPGAAAAE